jgi:hypothetical protein
MFVAAYGIRLDRGAVVSSIINIQKVYLNVSLRHIEEFFLCYNVWIASIIRSQQQSNGKKGKHKFIHFFLFLTFSISLSLSLYLSLSLSLSLSFFLLIRARTSSFFFCSSVSSDCRLVVTFATN